MTNKNDRLVIAYYSNKSAAEAAAEDLKQWDKANDDIKLGAIGVISLDENSGKIEVDEIGQRNTRMGALWGTAIGAGLGILTAGIALIPGLIAGAAIGGGLGALDHKSLGMSDADVAKLADNLKHGGVALGVMCDDFEVDATKAKLTEAGGTAEYYNVQEEAAGVITAAAEAQKEASAAVEEAVSSAVDDVTDVTRAVEAELPDLDTGKAAAIGGLAAAGGFAAAEAAKLNDVGVQSASSLLEMGATPAGREELAEVTGLDHDRILMGVKRLDLMRINGVGVTYAELLLVSGVETVPDLARRNAANLTTKMAEVNETEQVTEELPSEAQVTDWVVQAGDLPRMITY
jgi:uncharacterized membrane protein